MSVSGFGDLVESALAVVGIDPARVQRLLGRPCHCDERKERLNALVYWAHRVLAGKLHRADEYLGRLLGTDGMMGEEKETER